jgi:tetratricopeptide (TPR) repeat protein
MFLNMLVVFAQQGRADSLKMALQKAENDTIKMGLLDELLQACADYEYQGYLQQMRALAEKNLERKNLSPELKDFYQRNLAGVFNSLGLYYKTQGNLVLAMEYYHSSLALCEKIGEKEGTGAILNNLGSIYSELDDHARARDHFEKSLAVAHSIGKKRGVAVALNSIGLEFYYMGNFDSAMHYFEESRVIREELKDEKLIAINNDNMGLVLFKKGDYKRALDYHLRAFEIFEKNKNTRGLAYSNYYVGSIFFKMKDLALAKKFGERALLLSRKTGHPDAIRNATTLLRGVYKAKGNYRAALEMYELFVKMDDSLRNDNIKKTSVRKQFEYEYQKKATADSVKNQEKQKVMDAELSAQAAKLRQEKSQFWFVICGLSFVVIGLFFALNRFRITQRQKKTIERQKVQVDAAFSKLHERNKEVMDSIQYAKRIQVALLPSERKIWKELLKLKNKTE